MGRKPTTERCFYWTVGGYFYRLANGGLWSIDPNRRSDTWELLCQDSPLRLMTVDDLITNINDVGTLKEIPVSLCPFMDRPLPDLQTELDRKCNEQNVRTGVSSRAR